MDIPLQEEMLKNCFVLLLFTVTLSSPETDVQAPPVTSQPDAAAISNGNLSPSVPLLMPSMKKPWHQDVSQDLRNHLVHKVVQAIVPAPDPAVLLDSRFVNLVTYACNVEGKLCEFANSRDEYYHFVAEKVFKIQKELEERKREREGQTAKADHEDSGSSTA
ncbi:histone acetyltransferase p300-like isoform X2 [Pimephales promelas]|uniref:histone acetyltransferase p300-like isoform X2 n=1 Tax=Pimephales promelas TaxID=90988 RepID=UPI00195590EA|nr:histone acetyltransferase p300-like isoform X2 [Pimephales promelas]